MRRLLARNKYLKSVYKIATGHYPVYLDYPIDPTPRWREQSGNIATEPTISSAEATYRKNIDSLLEFKDIVVESIDNKETTKINWRNGYVPAMDALTIMWAATRASSTYMEVGSGNSTVFAHTALRRHSKQTKIISIDPAPRAEIDSLCDEVIRSPLEKTDLSHFDALGEGDTLFIDNSHRSFMNSDVTVFMLDVLPRLKPGVLVGIHDIFLPHDYFSDWAERGYNEQYLLACYLIANPDYFDIQFANYWICINKLHVQPLQPIWELLGDTIRDRTGSAFWGIKR